MKILIVDDVRVLRDGSENEDVTYARSSADALERLATDRWDEVWLDHDLGPDDDVRPVVRWLAEHRPGIGCVQVISWNPVGINYIIRSLSTVYPIQVMRRAGLVAP